LSESTTGAAIHYTTDGSTPSATSPTYTAPFTLASNASVKAFAASVGMSNSPLASASFVVTNITTSTNPVTGLALPAGWTNADIGTTGLKGSSGYTNGNWNINGSGADIWNTADAFQYAYVPFSGDGQIVAQ